MTIMPCTIPTTEQVAVAVQEAYDRLVAVIRKEQAKPWGRRDQPQPVVQSTDLTWHLQNNYMNASEALEQAADEGLVMVVSDYRPQVMFVRPLGTADWA